MANNQLTETLNRVALSAAAGRLADLGDGALLDRFVTGADEVAFADLVRRHGAMVYGVCSRIVGNRHDAEDACQATFLVLVHKAAGIRSRPSAASWLHGVARRVSLTLVRARADRQRRERGGPGAEPPATEPADLSWSHVQRILDEELDRLPDRLRAPIVLCYLEGKTRDEAAAALGLRQGQLHGLLQRGRTLLHDRLVSRGVTLGAGFLIAGLSGAAGLAFSPTLAIRITTRAAGPDAGPALGGARPTVLADAVLRTMLYANLRTTGGWVAASVLLIGGVLSGLLALPGFARQGDEPPRPAAGAPAQPPDRTPAGLGFRAVGSMPTDKPNDFRHAILAVSNEQAAVLSRNLIVTDRDDPKATTSGLHLWTLDKDKPKRTHLGDSTTVGFIPKSTLCSAVNWGEGVVLWDMRTHTQVGKPIPHALREDTMPLPAARPDGKVLVTRSKLNEIRFWDLRTQKPITEPLQQRGIVWKMEFSADGKWLFSESDPGELKVWDAETGKAVAGPLRHDVVGFGTPYSAKTHQLVTVENDTDKDGAGRGELVVRSSKDWAVVRRVQLPDPGRDVRWLDETHLLVVGDRQAKADPQGRPRAAGRNVLHVVTLDGEKSDVQTVLRDVPFIFSVDVATDGKHFLASSTGEKTSCWKLGDPKPVWTKPGGQRQRVQVGDGGWAVFNTKDGVIAYTLADGKEIWRDGPCEDVRVQGSDVWVFGRKSVDVWRVGPKAK